MGIFDRLNFKKEPPAKIASQAKEKEVKPALVKKAEKAEVKSAGAKKEIKGKTAQADRVIIKPLVTEKASTLSSVGKYVFSVRPEMNKIEVKKAIRAIYQVEPVNVRLANFSGKSVRYGKSSGKTKDWKKAIVTLKAGDKIEVYEGV